MEQWQAGARRLEEAPFDERPVLELVTREVHAELRRRLGSTFTTEELAELYDAGTGWVAGHRDRGRARRPRSPGTCAIVGDAAFARYLREASTTRAGAGSRERGAGTGGVRARLQPAPSTEPVDHPRPAEPQPRVEVLRGAVGVGEQERELVAGLLRRAARRPRRPARGRGATASCRRARPRRRAASRAAGTSTPAGRPRARRTPARRSARRGRAPTRASPRPPPRCPTARRASTRRAAARSRSGSTSSTGVRHLRRRAPRAPSADAG